jgi:prevent-host-death family protein
VRKLTIREARQALSRLDRLLAVEGEVTITRRGEPIARVVGLGKRRPIPSHKALRDKTPRMRTGSEKLIRADRDARS